MTRQGCRSGGFPVRGCRLTTDRTSQTGQMIDSYLQQKSHLDDHAIHLLFSANRWVRQPSNSAGGAPRAAAEAAKRSPLSGGSASDGPLILLDTPTRALCTVLPRDWTWAGVRPATWGCPCPIWCSTWIWIQPRLRCEATSETRGARQPAHCRYRVPTDGRYEKIDFQTKVRSLFATLLQQEPRARVSRCC